MQKRMTATQRQRRARRRVRELERRIALATDPRQAHELLEQLEEARVEQRVSSHPVTAVYA